MPLPVDLPATFTTGQALQFGVHPRQLYTWRDTGEIIDGRAVAQAQPLGVGLVQLGRQRPQPRSKVGG
ncbi:MAG TPA: hypothetical protein VFP72_19335 [Kineosporiaceae bacterium]|nr:hypothetical protein [Kineosporiaceae bacterium]